MLKGYKLKYVTYGYGDSGPKLYGVLMIKSDRGWVVEVWPCDIYGAQVFDCIEWNDELSWWSAYKLFRKWYKEYDAFVNYSR